MKSKPMMACGCVANATRGDKPACVVHQCFETVKTPNLTDRVSRCAYCKSERPSSPSLPFFEFRGVGSPHADEHCVCGYYHVAHVCVPSTCRCDDFRPRGPHDFDSYYCGCRGWD